MKHVGHNNPLFLVLCNWCTFVVSVVDPIRSLNCDVAPTLSSSDRDQLFFVVGERNKSFAHSWFIKDGFS